jgi:uncharacterized protein (TIGR02145 family)
MKSIISLTATLALATTLTLTACDEKKKQDSTDIKPPEAASETEAAKAAENIGEIEAEAARQEEADMSEAEEVVKGTFTDTRDSKTYKTVKIGEQVWMADNLNIDLPDSKCYENNPANCQKYGRLYNLKTAMKACPNGWHLPSFAEWSALTEVVGEISTDKYLKAKNGWEDEKGQSGNGEDKYGFSALPGGFVGSNGNFDDVGYNGYWWSVSEHGTNSYVRTMGYGDIADYILLDKNFLCSVRCVQN